MAKSPRKSVDALHAQTPGSELELPGPNPHAPSGASCAPGLTAAGEMALRFDIQAQPNDTACGPTCLSAVYSYYGDQRPIAEVAEQTGELPGGGTLAVMLGCHALERGYTVNLYTLNLNIFDPTWFRDGDSPSERAELLKVKLADQARLKRSDKYKLAAAAYHRFLDLGGQVHFKDLTSRLISGYLRKGVPILTGLSSTYLYRAAREFGPNDDDDDLRGTPSGHFVVIHGWNASSRMARIADPLADNPGFGSQCYQVEMSRLIGAILLGVLTYDANLLVIEPKASSTDPLKMDGEETD